MVGHGGSSAGSYLTDPTSPIPSHCASLVVASTVRVNSLWLVPCAVLWKLCDVSRTDHVIQQTRAIFTLLQAEYTRVLVNLSADVVHEFHLLIERQLQIMFKLHKVKSMGILKVTVHLKFFIGNT